MESPKITVIVPVYNVAAYIEKCAISLFQQTLDSLEILFIDDCSPDNSVEIIKETLKKYPVRNSLTRIIRMPSNGVHSGVCGPEFLQSGAHQLPLPAEGLRP